MEPVLPGPTLHHGFLWLTIALGGLGGCLNLALQRDSKGALLLMAGLTSTAAGLLAYRQQSLSLTTTRYHEHPDFLLSVWQLNCIQAATAALTLGVGLYLARSLQGQVRLVGLVLNSALLLALLPSLLQCVRAL